MTSQSHRDGGKYRYLHRLTLENPRNPRPLTLHNCTWSFVHNPANTVFSRRTTYYSPQILVQLLCFLAAVQATSALTFDNPNIGAQSYCSTLQLSWSGGTPPYELQVNDVNLFTKLQDFHNITYTTVEWVEGGEVGGRNVQVVVLDSNGQSAKTGQIPVAPASGLCSQQPVLHVGVSPTGTTTALTPVPTTSTSPPQVPSTSPRTSQTTSPSQLPSPTSSHSATVTLTSSASTSSPASTPSSTSISSTSTTSDSETTSTQTPQSSSSTSTTAPTQSPPTTPSSSGASTSLPPSSSSTPTPKRPVGPPKSRPHSLSPGVKATIAIAVIVFITGLSAFVFWLRRRAFRRGKLVRSSGERADLNQESRPLLAELESPGRALVAQRAWAGSSPPWASGQGGGVFNPNEDGEDYVLVIQHPPPRSTDAQASGWQSDFNRATATTMTTRTSAGRPSLISTTTRAPVHDDRYADSPIDPLLLRRGSTRPSSHVLPSAGANTTSDLEAFYALMDAEAASHTRAGLLTGTEIDSAVDTASEREEWDALSASDTRSVRTLPPPYHHHSV